MAATPRRGAVSAPRSGVYRDPATDGVKDTGGPGSYRPPADGIKDITEINYIPYGGVYEREGEFPYDMVATGGAYERYTEVAPAALSLILASRTYPPVNTDVSTVESFITGGTLLTSPSDGMVLSSTIVSGSLNTLLQTYSNWPAEVASVDSTITGGALAVALISYTQPIESMSLDESITGGTLVTALISYTNWPSEDMVIDSIIAGGSLA